MDHSAPRQKASTNGLFQCTACKRAYSRVDHLARHVRSHLQERPFKCDTCHKAFGRPDLLKRHYSCHEGEQDGSRASKRQQSSSSRVFQACRACAAAKLKCDDGKPCSRCTNRGIQCDYVTDPHEPERAARNVCFQNNIQDAESILSPEVTPVPPPEPTTMDLALPADMDGPDPVPPSSTTDSVLDNRRQSEPDRSMTSDQASHLRRASAPGPDMSAVDPLGQDMSSFLLEVMMPNVDPTYNFMPMKSSNVQGLLDFSIDADSDLNDTDYGFLDQLCSDPFSGDLILAPQQHQQQQQQQQQPPQLGHPAIDPVLQPRLTLATLAAVGGEAGASDAQQLSLYPPYQQTPHLSHLSHPHPSQLHAPHPPLALPAGDASGPSATTQQHIALGTEAFRRSALGKWLPAQQDCGVVQMEHLSILGNEAGSPDARIRLDRRCLRESLDRPTRDELLAMVLRTCRTERMTFVVRSFPDAGLLDDLVQCFFSHHQQQVDSYIHTPTFRINGQRPELLGAIVATGATLTDVRALRKLGYALQEAVRLTVPGTCESANSITRQLWMLQAVISELQTGMWSGLKRKMEISESHIQVAITMLRRAGRFQQTKSAPVDPLPEDTGEVLRRKWLDWCEQESFKRLAFHAFIFDAMASMAMLTTPIVSFSELALSFPETRDLWMAEDAEQWKTLCLNRTLPAHRQLSLLDFLRLDCEIPDYYDVPLCSLVILFCQWGMITRHLELVAVMNRPPSLSPSLATEHGSSPPGSACLALRHQELLQMLQHFRIHMGEGQLPPSPETSLVLELLHVHLHCNFSDLQLFAGKGDISDARRALPALQQWMGGRESRLAVWHAGQVLRAAAGFPAKQLSGFYAVAVYHAGLTLWVYSVIAHAKGLPGPAGAAPVSSHSRSMRSSRSQPMSPPDSRASMPPSRAQTVCLDGTDSPAVQRFIALGKGLPTVGMSKSGPSDPSGLGGPSGPGQDQVSLYEPRAVLGDVVVGILRRNFPSQGSADTEESLPPLVENLVQLLRGLAKAASSTGS